MIFLLPRHHHTCGNEGFGQMVQLINFVVINGDMLPKQCPSSHAPFNTLCITMYFTITHPSWNVIGNPFLAKGGNSIFEFHTMDFNWELYPERFDNAGG
jgi:hypothetical protein